MCGIIRIALRVLIFVERKRVVRIEKIKSINWPQWGYEILLFCSFHLNRILINVIKRGQGALWSREPEWRKPKFSRPEAEGNKSPEDQSGGLVQMASIYIQMASIYIQ